MGTNLRDHHLRHGLARLAGYLGWLALRLRGARAELAAVSELVRESSAEKS